LSDFQHPFVVAWAESKLQSCPHRGLLLSFGYNNQKKCGKSTDHFLVAVLPWRPVIQTATVFCLLLELEPTDLGTIDRAIPYPNAGFQKSKLTQRAH
jgi:hypothetical protein